MRRTTPAALRRPGLRERVIAAGLDPPETGPEKFQVRIAAETATWAKLVREAGIGPD